jgi:hypothetical protein
MSPWPDKSILNIILVKQSHYTPWRRLGERRYNSYSFLTSALVGSVSVTLWPCFTTGKWPPVPIGQEAEWAPEPVWTQSVEKKSSARDRTPIARSPARSQTLYWQSNPSYLNVISESQMFYIQAFRLKYLTLIILEQIIFSTTQVNGGRREDAAWRNKRKRSLFPCPDEKSRHWDHTFGPPLQVSGTRWL